MQSIGIWGVAGVAQKRAPGPSPECMCLNIRTTIKWIWALIAATPRPHHRQLTLTANKFASEQNFQHKSNKKYVHLDFLHGTCTTFDIDIYRILRRADAAWQIRQKLSEALQFPAATALILRY